MSLQVWLPLNGNLNNQGVSNVTVTNSNATVDASGKIGSCYRFNKNAYLSVPGSVATSFTIACSVSLCLKINSFNAAYDTYFQIGIDTTPWTSYRMGLLRSNSASTLTFVISDGSTSTQNSFTTPAISNGVWTHLTLVYKTGHCLIYVNGALHADNATTVVPKFSDVTKIMIGGLSGSYKSDSYINDFRIYDHALSAKEVKEISKALILHYPLDGNGKGQDNYYVNSNFYTNSTSNWYGVNSSSISTTVKDNKKVITSTKGTSNYLFGQTITNYSYTANLEITFTISADIYAETSGTIYIGNWISTSQASGWQAMSFTEVWNTSNVLKVGWNHVSVTHKNAKNQYNGNIVTAFGYSSATYFATNIKFEFGDIDTPWCPNSAETIYTTLGYNSTTEIDTSGYGNNGTRSGNISSVSDTPRLNSATYFPAGSGIYSHPNISLSTYTFSFWGKHTDVGKMLMGNSDTATSTKRDWYWYGDNSFKYPGGEFYYNHNAGTAQALLNKWTHFVAVYDGSNITVYRNSINEGSKAATGSMLLDYLSVGIGFGSSSYWENGYISDFRLYATALSADDVKELYQSAASVDNEGNFFCYEISEPSSVNRSAVMKTGEVTATGDTVNPNMILSTPRSYVSANYNAYILNLNENMVAGEKYTLQYWDADVSHTGKTSTQLSIATYWGGGMNIQAEFKIPTGHSDYVVKTFTAQKNAQPSDGDKMWFNVYNSPGDASGTRYMHIGKWKLEKGDVATPYVPPAFKTFDSTIYAEPDGSRWVKIVRHSHPDTTKFVSSDVFTAYTYKAADVWFCGALCNEVTSGYWELMVKQALTSGGTESKYRWIQQTNPMAGSYNETVAANIQRNTSSGYSTANYGGIYKFNSNTYLVGNNGASGNWFGAFGCWTAYNGGIPGFFGGAVTTGYMDLYLRIDTAVDNADCDAGFIEESLPPAKVGDNWVQSHEFIER